MGKEVQRIFDDCEKNQRKDLDLSGETTNSMITELYNLVKTLMNRKRNWIHRIHFNE